MLASFYSNQFNFLFNNLKNLGHDGGSGSGNQVPEYRGIRHAFSKIYSEEGFKGLYKGFAWTLFA